MSDASQQSRYNYLLTVEYRTIFPANPAAVTDMVEASPLRWFKHERRTLPITVVGHGNSSYAAKAHRVLCQLATESSPQDFTDRRRTVSGWLADQNVELKICDAPFDDSNTLGTLEDLSSGTKAWSDSDVHLCYAFPFCLTIFAHLHIIFNALEEAFKSHELWDRFETLLKAVLSLLGDQPQAAAFHSRVHGVSSSLAETDVPYIS